MKKIFERIQEKKENRKLIEKENYETERKNTEKKINCNKKIMSKNEDDTEEGVMKKVEMFENKIQRKSVENSNVKMKKKIQTKLGQQMKFGAKVLIAQF